MDSVSKSDSKMSASLPPVSASCTVKRSFVKMTSKEFSQSNESMPTIVLRKDLSDRKIVELRNRSESPTSVVRLKFCDNSSGYGSASSFASTLHSIQKTPSIHCFTTFNSQPSVMKIERPNKAQMIKDSIVNTLDQIDKRVAFLRETAAELEEEKQKLYRVLNSIMTSEELDSVEEVEQEEIKVTTNGLLYRLNSVDVVIKTPRTESQQKALELVTKYIEKLTDYIKTDRERAKQICQSYLGACSSADIFSRHPTDEKFQKIIVECSIDDQKVIKKKLENLFLNLNRLEIQ